VNDHSPSHNADDNKAAWNLMRLTAQTFAHTVEPILHVGMGHRYFGFKTVLVFFFTGMFASIWPTHDPTPMFWLFVAFLIGCVLNRIHGLRAWYRRESAPHSYYNGYPRLCYWLPWLSEWTAKRFVEPMLVGGASFAISFFNKPLSVYLCFSAVSLVIMLVMHDLSHRNQAADAYDAMIQQRQMRQRFERMRGNP
jgi:hypothetical protein